VSEKRLRRLLNHIINSGLDDEDFIHEVKIGFSINNLCILMGINRNRYNYLVRTNQLDDYILKLKEVLDDE